MLIFPTANQNGIKQNCDKVNWNDPRTSCHVTITVSCNCRIFLTESSIIVSTACHFQAFKSFAQNFDNLFAL